MKKNEYNDRQVIFRRKEDYTNCFRLQISPVLKRNLSTIELDANRSLKKINPILHETFFH